jgi:alkanesulfonate monooxygenase SsuD/methylene tetrahydromethanopterin reductase-like flavin-dependent oxidoreductase (luciferase family)
MRSPRHYQLQASSAQSTTSPPPPPPPPPTWLRVGSSDRRARARPASVAARHSGGTVTIVGCR